MTVAAVKLVGFRGKDATDRAMARSRYASATPSVRRLADGSLVGVGDPIVDRRGRQDVMLYGARGTSAWASDVDRRPSEGRPEAERDAVVVSMRLRRPALAALDALATARGLSRGATVAALVMEAEP